MISANATIIIVAFLCGAVALFVLGLILQQLRYSRKQQESRMSEERYLQALESSTDGLWDWNLQSDSVIYSDGFRKTLGVSPQEVPREHGLFAQPTSSRGRRCHAWGHRTPL